MVPARQLTFGPFRFDLANECLWEGDRSIALRPKVFAVLKYLLERPRQLVTKQQLLDAVWADTFVGDAVLKDSIRQLREILGDDAAAPQYIETAHRRGYRFIGQVAESASNVNEPSLPSAPVAAAATAAAFAPSSFSRSRADVLGRDDELLRMRGSLERALRGERQIVFVTGEPGIGKTTLVNAWLEQAAAMPGILVARGQCLEQYGAGEPYLPVLDAFSRLGRGPGGERLVALLRQHAPAWLAELPSLMDAAERDALRQQAAGATRERMLRQMAEAIEAMTAEHEPGSAPLLLVLEDLHWSDFSTIDLVAYLARRRDPARLMVIGTYRPVDVILSEHPLKGVKRELQAHGLCQELPLEYLTEEAVAQYLELRCPRHQLPPRLARLIHRRTEGNPLFLVNVVHYLIDERVLVEDAAAGTWRLEGEWADVESAVPENVRALIEKQIERLSADERAVLEGASVVGMDCSSVAIAAGLAADTAWVEERCEELVRRHQFLLPARLADLPDGTVTPRYTFCHMLYLDVPYSLLSQMRRSQIHRRIGDCGEVVYGARVPEIAAELAMHFEQGRDPKRAVKYLLMAAEIATHRSAHHEAAALAARGVQAIAALPESPERVQQEIRLCMILGASLTQTKGFSGEEVGEVYGRARMLCEQQGASADAFWVQWLRGLFHYFRGELTSSREIAEDLVTAGTLLADDACAMEGRRACGAVLIELGEAREALAQFDEVARLYDANRDHAHATLTGHDPLVVSHCFAARALWSLGNPDEALERVKQAVTVANRLSHTQSLVVAAHFSAVIHQLRGEVPQCRERAASAVALADEYGLELWSALGQIYLGWAMVQQGHERASRPATPAKLRAAAIDAAASDAAQIEAGLALMQRGLAVHAVTGARLWRPYFLAMLAESLDKANRRDDALTAISEALALARETGEAYALAELHRLHGELLLRAPVSATAAKDAAACFDRALEIARAQGAVGWERRAAASRATLP